MINRKLKYILAFCLLYSGNTFGQDLGLYCRPVTFNDEKANNSIRYTRSIESVISRIDGYPRTVEREKFDEITEILQEEVNRLLDLNQEARSKFTSAKIGWLLISNFLEKPIQGKYILQIQIVNAQNNNAFASVRLPSFEFSETELSNIIVFESKLEGYLKEYVINNEFGVIERSKLMNFENKLNNRGFQIDSLRSIINRFPENTIAISRVSVILDILRNDGQRAEFDELLEFSSSVNSVSVQQAAKLVIDQFLKEFWNENHGQRVEDTIDQYGLDVNSVDYSNNIIVSHLKSEGDIIMIKDLLNAYNYINKTQIDPLDYRDIIK